MQESLDDLCRKIGRLVLSGATLQHPGVRRALRDARQHRVPWNDLAREAKQELHQEEAPDG